MFVKIYNKQYLGYQNLNESLNWLRSKLRYGKNPSDNIILVVNNINWQSAAETLSPL